MSKKTKVPKHDSQNLPRSPMPADSLWKYIKNSHWNNWMVDKETWLKCFFYSPVKNSMQFWNLRLPPIKYISSSIRNLGMATRAGKCLKGSIRGKKLISSGKPQPWLNPHYYIQCNWLSNNKLIIYNLVREIQAPLSL